jgi:cyclophilin family peptidyl-prolyl cis-trans isomerase
VKRLILETEKGAIVFELDALAAPNTVAAIVDSARRGTYDGAIWHRVMTGFVVQGGDPRGSGWGDAGYRLEDEVNRRPFLRGTLGIPKAGPDTGGCQLFVTLVPTPHLDGRYTAFGRVVAGMELLDALEPGDQIVRALAPKGPY